MAVAKVWNSSNSSWEDVAQAHVHTGMVAFSTATITANTSAVSGQTLFCNAAAGGFTVTIPPTATHVRVKKIDTSSNQVVIKGLSGAVDNSAQFTLNTYLAAAELFGDGTNLWLM